MIDLRDADVVPGVDPDLGVLLDLHGVLVELGLDLDVLLGVDLSELLGVGAHTLRHGDGCVGTLLFGVIRFLV